MWIGEFETSSHIDVFWYFAVGVEDWQVSFEFIAGVRSSCRGFRALLIMSANKRISGVGTVWLDSWVGSPRILLEWSLIVSQLVARWVYVQSHGWCKNGEMIWRCSILLGGIHELTAKNVTIMGEIADAANYAHTPGAVRWPDEKCQCAVDFGLERLFFC